jgi:hypothetical protein
MPRAVEESFITTEVKTLGQKSTSSIISKDTEKTKEAFLGTDWRLQWHQHESIPGAAYRAFNVVNDLERYAGETPSRDMAQLIDRASVVLRVVGYLWPVRSAAFVSSIPIVRLHLPSPRPCRSYHTIA